MSRLGTYKNEERFFMTIKAKTVFTEWCYNERGVEIAVAKASATAARPSQSWQRTIPPTLVLFRQSPIAEAYLSTGAFGISTSLAHWRNLNLRWRRTMRGSSAFSDPIR
jgi:hypothetical protein